MARMSCHRVHQALCLLTLAVAGAGFSVASARAADLGEQIRAVKAARSEVELRQRLEQLGFSRGLVDKAAAAKDAYGKSVFKLEQLKRAEMWEVNLDPDADKERVVQVLLKSESEMMQFTSLYLILVLDSQAQGGKVLTELVFELAGCDYIGDKPMILGFAPVPGKKYKEVRFEVKEATACGTTVEAVSRRDVLGWNEKSGRLELSRGKGKRTDSVDRLKATESE
jgi:uncharacterized cupredoxin-like copper-binding protein